MSALFDSLCWECPAFPDAVFRLLRRSGADGGGRVDDIPPDAATRGGAMERWLFSSAHRMGYEGDVMLLPWAELRAALTPKGPYLVLLRRSADGRPEGIVALSNGDDTITVVRPRADDRVLPLAELHTMLHALASTEDATAALFAGLPNGDKVCADLARTEKFGRRAFAVVRYSLDGTNSLATQLAEQNVGYRVAGYAAISLLKATLAILAAWSLGEAALTGLVDRGRISAWCMLAASDIPLQYMASTLVGALSLDFAGIVKKRLLEGALRSVDKETRRQSFAIQLARLSEASIIEQTNPAQLLGLVPAAAQLVGAVWLFWRAPYALVFLLLLVGFFGALVAWAFVLRRRHRTAYLERLDLSEDLVEKIIGHRTRAVQANDERLHDAEDFALDRYAKAAAGEDTIAALIAGSGRLWMSAAGMVLVYAFAFQTPPADLLRIALGVFLAYRAFAATTNPVGRLVNWLDAWRGVRAFFEAGYLRARETHATHTDERGLDTMVSSLSFAYRAGGRPVFADASLRIANGDRVLVEGPSGGGKSTLAKLLTGELRAVAGTVLVDGVDRHSVSDEDWRSRIAASPQFHENYVFANTFVFNVDPGCTSALMTVEARSVCEELGLGPLLAKMPSREFQLLGETGWQLSHGERSRVFVARSLLQGARLLVFDESFGALDPESLTLAIECVRRRAGTLIVIAHT